MSLPTLLLIALGVSADAFAVSLAKGLQLTHLRLRVAVSVALTFGVFQGAMPLIGYLLGSRFSGYVTEVDHWIAFGLLTAVGLKMLWEALVGGDDDEQSDAESIPLGELLVLGLATSIDALAVGISFAFIDVQIVPTVLAIGVTTFVLSLGGVYLGRRAGKRFSGPAEIAGGLVLIGIGAKILLDHLGVW